jgi:PhzF family phenazine biosynthesis protein
VTRLFRYRVVNVFAVPGDPFSGNPLCVFEDAAGMTDVEMQALARQFNLTETSFLLPSALPTAMARVRIFKPDLEMPYAGHPILGAAHVVRAILQQGDAMQLELATGLIDVVAQGAWWKFRVPHAPRSRPHRGTRGELAEALGLRERDLGDKVMFVDTAVDQLIVPLARPELLYEVAPEPGAFAKLARSKTRRESVCYLWSVAEDGAFHARCLYLTNAGILEDPATGSAVGNLGGWMILNGDTEPGRWTVHQGQATGRPSRLELELTADGQIDVYGLVSEIGAGVIELRY